VTNEHSKEIKTIHCSVAKYESKAKPDAQVLDEDHLSNMAKKLLPTIRLKFPMAKVVILMPNEEPVTMAHLMVLTSSNHANRYEESHVRHHDDQVSNTVKKSKPTPKIFIHLAKNVKLKTICN